MAFGAPNSIDDYRRRMMALNQALDGPEQQQSSSTTVRMDNNPITQDYLTGPTREPELNHQFVQPENRWWADTDLNNDRGSTLRTPQTLQTAPDPRQPAGGGTGQPGTPGSTTPITVPFDRPSSAADLRIAGFDTGRAQDPSKSAKDLFLQIMQRTGYMPTTFADAEAFARSVLVPEFAKGGYNVFDVNKDKIRIGTRENPGGEWVDWLVNAGGDPSTISAAWQSDTPGAGINTDASGLTPLMAAQQGGGGSSSTTAFLPMDANQGPLPTVGIEGESAQRLGLTPEQMMEQLALQTVLGGDLGGLGGGKNDITLEDAQARIAHAYETFLGRTPSAAEIGQHLSNQGWRPGHRFVGAQGLNYILDQIARSPEGRRGY